MLETTYVLVIDTKNLLDTLDTVRIAQMTANMKNVDGQLTDDEQTTDTATESQPSSQTVLEPAFGLKTNITSKTKAEVESEQIYENDGVRAN